ncbi:galactose-1-phosphate uridylyltransferase, partial [Streptomyces nigrescens]
RTEFPQIYLEVLRRFDRIFAGRDGGKEAGRDGGKEGEGASRGARAAGAARTPYIAAWHQAPLRAGRREDFALHLELFTIRRTSGKLKFLAGSESGMNVFINDVPPEAAAERLREVASE